MEGKAPSERFKTYAQGLALIIPAVTGLILGVAGFLKSGDAQEAGDQIWVKLRNAVNTQAEVINKLQMRMVALQARQEGQTAGKLQADLEALQKRYDEMVAQRAARRESRKAKLETLQKDLEMEKLKRRRLEGKMDEPFPPQRPAAPTMIPQLPRAYRKGK